MMIDWEDFDIPDSRKDVTNVWNARWVLRNLAIQNENHPRCNEVIDLVISNIRSMHEEVGLILRPTKEDE